MNLGGINMGLPRAHSAHPPLPNLRAPLLHARVHDPQPVAPRPPGPPAPKNFPLAANSRP